MEKVGGLVALCNGLEKTFDQHFHETDCSARVESGILDRKRADALDNTQEQTGGKIHAELAIDLSSLLSGRH